MKNVSKKAWGELIGIQDPSAKYGVSQFYQTLVIVNFYISNGNFEKYNYYKLVLLVKAGIQQEQLLIVTFYIPFFICESNLWTFCVKEFF